jgi:hypothetical protein
MSDLFPPPLALAKVFCRSGYDRDFLWFPGVKRSWLFTGVWFRLLRVVLSAPKLSGPLNRMGLVLGT